MTKLPQNTLVYTVSRLNTEVRQVLESGFPLIWVEGEISNLSTPRSGHMYFSLKDSHAQSRCAMFRMKRQLLRFQPTEGQKVLARARLTLYEARGDFQLVIEHMEPAGEGALRQAIEALKQKLDTEGLFDPQHKKDLPAYPSTVGVITSATGAAIRDVLHVFARRFPTIRIIVYPVLVQGDQAAADINATLKLADQRNECDLFILTRGGGSLEDLMAFNDEQLARTIFALNTPIISAIGHEIDTSISDYVADRRAPTPSAAAELASPDALHLDQQLNKTLLRLQQQMKSILRHAQQRADYAERRLQPLSPQRSLHDKQQKLDNLFRRLKQYMHAELTRHKHRSQQSQQRLQFNSPGVKLRRIHEQFNHLQNRLIQSSPADKIKRHEDAVSRLEKRLFNSVNASLQQRQQQLSASAKLLESVSPLSILSRGYSITRSDSGTIIKSAEQLQTGDSVTTRFAKGSIISEVKSVEMSNK